MRSLIPCVAITLLTLLFGACSQQSSAPKAAENSHAAPIPPKNCLFIILDAFDAGHVSHLGYPRETTPNLDALAASGVTFAKAYSQTSSTNSSVKSYFTGRYPARAHGEKEIYGITPRDYTLAQAFQDAGFKTAGYSENTFIKESLGFNQGFQEFKYEGPLLPKDESLGYKPRDQEATTRLIAAARDWIASRRNGERWFCYLHLLRPHNPYTVPESFAHQETTTARGVSIGRMERRLLSGFTKLKGGQKELEVARHTARYDTNIEYVDYLLGELIDWLDANHELDSTLVIVASDHGEAFNQHGKFGHNKTLYEEMIHVPLVFRPPNSAAFLNTKVDHPVEMVDLFPTLAELFSLTPRNSTDGKSLMPYFFGERNPHKETLFALTHDNTQLAVRYGNRKLLLLRTGENSFLPRELFDLSEDPLERHNLLDSSSQLDQFNALTQKYLNNYFVRTEEQTPAMSQADIETLEALGYLQGPEGTPPAPSSP